MQESTDQKVVYQNRERIKKRFKPTVKPSQEKSYKFKNKNKNNMSQNNAQEKIRTVKISTFDPKQYAFWVTATQLTFNRHKPLDEEEPFDDRPAVLAPPESIANPRVQANALEIQIIS